MTKPEFTFERSMITDSVIVGITHDGSSRTITIDGFDFEINPSESLPDELVAFTDQFNREVSEFLQSERDAVADEGFDIKGLL